MKKIRVLFVCVHNSARSQMAEAFLNSVAGDRFESFSAGLEPGILNDLAVEAMRETGIDISRNRTKGVFDLIREGALFHYVINVCDVSGPDRCPIFPGYAKRIQWSFPDPSGLEGPYEERLAMTRIIRDAIRDRITQWIDGMPADSNC